MNTPVAPTSNLAMHHAVPGLGNKMPRCTFMSWKENLVAVVLMWSVLTVYAPYVYVSYLPAFLTLWRGAEISYTDSIVTSLLPNVYTGWSRGKVICEKLLHCLLLSHSYKAVNLTRKPLGYEALTTALFPSHAQNCAGIEESLFLMHKGGCLQ